ncbi:MAG TPA: GTP 3',8-cyclase MoaA [Vicinamibacteria bacterium]|nr:GTP 3',8-cyclase MoaA [Vicinamibacteria bacterium]
MPRDRFGREINYLRISVIDHCNLRCVYCMPLRGLSFVPSPELLTAEEIETVAQAAVEVGFHKFRLTGGEPTLRPDIVEIVGRIAATPGVEDVSMTTNAVLLPRLAAPLAEAGLRRLNIHVDTFHPERLKKIMRFGSIDEIEAGIAAAEAAGLRPIKINCVVTRDYNDEDVTDLALRARERNWHVRFIELMPLGGGETAHVALAQFVPTRETKQRIEEALGRLVPVPGGHPSDESKNFRFADGKGGVIGFISPVSEPYCGSCNRMRLTADGKFHLCLLNDDELDVKKALRTGGGVPAVSAILSRAVALKPTGHRLDEGVSTEERQMFQIGG